METIVRFAGGVKFEAETRGHKVLCDQPVESGGENQAMSPPEFLLASLGTCAAYYALQYLKTRSLSVEGLQVRVKAEKALHPARIGTFEIEVEAPAAEDERHREGILRAVKACLIHNTLLNAPAIAVRVDTPVSVGRA